MQYYQELTLLPDAEVSTYFLWSKVYQQIHLALVESLEENKSRIGISFPEYRDNIVLGSKLRLFAESESELKDLDIDRWTNRLKDYVHITSIRVVPENTTFAHFQRYQPSAINKERLARRRVKRKNETYEQALAHYESLRAKTVREPFVRLKSLTNGNQFSLFIKKRATESFVSEGYSSYGLSNISSVPDF